MTDAPETRVEAAPKPRVAVDVGEAELDAWCEARLGSGVRETLFSSGNLSVVRGVRLADGREVVVKIRPDHPRLAGCAAVHLHMWSAGFPCPPPLAGPRPLGSFAADAEVLLDGGGRFGSGVKPDASPDTDPGTRPGKGSDADADADVDAGGDTAAAAFAALLARFLCTAPPAAQVPSLDPAPAWMHWYHGHPGVWPPPDDRPDDLNALPETAWLDELGAAVRRRLEPLRAAERVIGHCDWEAQNIRWRGFEPWAVHDWDSVVAEPELVIVGEAASMWPASMEAFGATVRQTEAFLDAYQDARGRAFTPDELESAWAAGLWVRSFNGKKFLLDGVETLTADEAAERARRAGIA